MTNEEILEQARALHLIRGAAYTRVDEAMNAARRDEAVRFAEFSRKNIVYGLDGCWHFPIADGVVKVLTDIELYEIFKQQ